MDFSRISIRVGWSRQRGLSLVEVLIGLFLGVMLSLAVVSFSVRSGKSLAGIFHYVDMQYASRRALDWISRDVRQAWVLQGFLTNRLALVDADGQPLVFEYDPAKETLVRLKGSEKTVLLTQCRNFRFAAYKQVSKPGTLGRDLSAKPAAAKVIQVSWDCYREILGAKLTTETVDGAKIVIRN